MQGRKKGNRTGKRKIRWQMRLKRRDEGFRGREELQHEAFSFFF